MCSRSRTAATSSAVSYTHLEFIKLDALLKFAALTATGGEAKQVITDGMVAVNGETCTMRGKKIRPGDTVTFAGHTLKVQSAQ